MQWSLKLTVPDSAFGVMNVYSKNIITQYSLLQTHLKSEAKQNSPPKKLDLLCRSVSLPRPGTSESDPDLNERCTARRSMQCSTLHNPADRCVASLAWFSVLMRKTPCAAIQPVPQDTDRTPHLTSLTAQQTHSSPLTFTACLIYYTMYRLLPSYTVFKKNFATCEIVARC